MLITSFKAAATARNFRRIPRSRQAIYDVCRDYYPLYSVARIDDCVRTHLMLIDRLEQREVRQTIYELCDAKWRKHSARAVNNCSVVEANYFRSKGRYRGE